jgi:DnaJ-class molecular chaperone
MNTYGLLETIEGENNNGVKLLSDEVVCDKCNGTGLDLSKLPISDHSYSSISNQCNKCYGTGKVTWLENVLGKENPYVKYGSGYGYVGSSGFSGVSGVGGVSGYA